MTDIKILAIHDILPIYSVNFASGVTPLTLILVGERFNEASKIFINDSQVEEFVIISTSKIYAQLPNALINAVINKIAVIAETPSVDRSSLLSFEVGNSFRGLSGIERLVQLFCKLLLQTPGTDKFHPNLGGGLLSIIGTNVPKNDSRNIQSAVISAVSRTRDQISAIQNQNPRIPTNEKLLSATTDAVGFNASTTTLSATIFLTTIAGRSAVANITF